MRKIGLFTALAVALAFVFAACSSDGGSDGKTDKTAAALLDTVLNSIEFPQTVEVTDENRLTEMGLDMSLIEEYAVVQQMLSVDVVEVIILKPKDGDADKLTEQLEARKESLINDFAFYPEQVASANATVVGSEKNVAYLICHVDAAEAEKALVDEING